jgi:hypothetical protein
LKRGNTKGTIFNELINELIVLAEMEGAQSTCLNIIENTPVEIQIKIIQSLAKTNNPKLIPLFQMLAREMEGEVQKLTQIALRKYQYLGYEIKLFAPQEIKAGDIEAFTSLTRLEGACILVFIHHFEGKYHAYYFSLALNSLGIKEYFQYSSIHKEDLLNIIEKQNLRKIDFSLAQRLLKDAHSQNMRFGTKAASGFSQYKFLFNINQEKGINSIELSELFNGELKPEQIINIYFFALKNMDSALVYDLVGPKLQEKFGSRDDFIAKWKNPLQKCTFIKSVPLDWEENQSFYHRRYHLIVGNENDELQKYDFYFVLEKGENWRISEVKIECFRPIGYNDPLNPLNYQVYASVYKINNGSLLNKIFDSWNQVHLTGEFEGGNCYKWFKTGNVLNIGIDVARDIYSEFILTNQELIIFNSNLQNLTEVGYFFQEQVLQKNYDIKIQLLVKGPCRVRDVYRVITEKDFSLGDHLAMTNNIYYLELKDNHEYWHSLFLKAAEKKYSIKEKVLVFELKEGSIEVLCYDKHSFIFAYNDSENIIERKWPDLWKSLNDISYDRGNRDEKEKWLYYKLINNLKKDPLTRIFIPQDLQLEMAKKMRLIK